MRVRHQTGRFAEAEEPDPLRQRLAVAITAHQAAASRLEVLQAATDRAIDARIDARRRVQQAETVLSEARSPRALADALIAGGDVAVAGIGVVDAEGALSRAREQHRMAAEAGEAIAREVEAARRDLDFRRAAVDAAVSEVIIGSAELAALLSARRAALAALARVNKAIEAIGAPRLPQFWDEVPGVEAIDGGLGERWARALESLQHDAGAALPGNDPDPVHSAAA